VVIDICGVTVGECGRGYGSIAMVAPRFWRFKYHVHKIVIARQMELKWWCWPSRVVRNGYLCDNAHRSTVTWGLSCERLIVSKGCYGDRSANDSCL